MMLGVIDINQSSDFKSIKKIKNVYYLMLKKNILC